MINKRGVKGLVLEREKYVCLDSFAAEIGTFKLVNATGGTVFGGRY